LFTLFESVNGADVRMIERRENLCLAMEARKSIRIARESRRQNFQRDVAIELRITCAIHITHAACANGDDDFIRSEASAGTERHVRLWRGLYAANPFRSRLDRASEFESSRFCQQLTPGGARLPREKRQQ
jgi:hypothetical protein